MAVTVFGISHQYTTFDTLEQITFSLQNVMQFLPLLSREDRIDECVILSTCNRIEVYPVCQEEFPVFIKRAESSKIYDVDGNEYIGFVNLWGLNMC